MYVLFFMEGHSLAILAVYPRLDLRRPGPVYSGNDITNINHREKGRAQSLEPEKKRQRDELASGKGETGEQGKSGGSQAVC